METTGHSQAWAGDSNFGMIDVGPKEATFRRATAQGTISLASDAYEAIVQKTNPKGDVIAVAELAGIQAAKRTSEWIPLCHPLPLEQVRLKFEFLAETHSIRVHCQVSTTAKTGVEMEALCGVNGALLSIYDLSKAVNPVLTISEIRLNVKEGGKSGLWHHPDHPPQATVAQPQLLQGTMATVITVSDRCSRGEAEDRSGPELKRLLEASGAKVLGAEVVADQIPEIQRAVLLAVKDSGSRLVILTGGTGLSPRDVTPEALAPLWTRRIPGIGEHLRAQGATQTRMSWLSRSEAGLIDGKLVILLPGSLRAVQQGWGLLKELIPHALHISEGGAH